MSWAARIVAAGATFLVVACAAIAGLDDPTAVDEANSSSGGSSGNRGSSNGGSGGGSSGGSSSGSLQDTGTASSSGSTSGDASNDANTTPDAPACTKLPNGDTCSQPSQCCSGKCNEKKQCANDCKSSGVFNCNPLADNECCLALWCNNGTCQGCIASGQPAGTFPGGALLNSASCCSRTLNGGNCQ